ncbi:MAG TPA: hypothetical protein VI821_00105 [Candidatus Paceibacterota bacterium]
MEKTITNYCTQFNISVVELFKIFKTQITGDVLSRTETLEIRVNRAKQTDNTYLIRTVGEKIYNYRKEIAERNEKFFLDDNFSIENDEADNTELVKLVKQVYRSSKKADQDNVYSHIMILLRMYALWCLSQKT